MSPTAPERSAPRPVDAAALARVQRRLQSAAGAPWLHGEVARRMAERLPVIRLQPDRVLDWGAHVGGSRPLLGRSYPKARIVAVESDAAACAATAAALQSPWWSPRRWLGQPPQVLTAASLAPAAGQLLWSNMGLHGVVDPQAEMASWHRAIAVDGFLMFSTLGPGTLQALSELYAQQGWGPAMAPLVDMHDLGDMLVQAGFADPVMDQETLSLSWPSAAALLAELRALGGNADPRRCAGLRAALAAQSGEGAGAARGARRPHRLAVRTRLRPCFQARAPAPHGSTHRGGAGRHAHHGAGRESARLMQPGAPGTLG